MSAINQTTTEIKLYDENKKKLCNYITRDLFLWFIFIFILPVLLFIVYTASKNSIENILPKEDLINEPMFQVLLKNYPNSICNDGSPASYYIRLSKSSKIWIIVLDGGYFCHDKSSCSQRKSNSYNLTSSRHNKHFKFGSGILSSDPSENKYFSNENQVNIPYCSSDLWTGSKKCANCSDEFNFMGSEIINDIFNDLLSNTEIKKANLVLLTGVSAGGIGLLMNINKINKKFQLNAPHVKLKMVLDSSWQLDLPYSYLCTEKDCPIDNIFMNSLEYWNAQIPVECKEKKKMWNCFLPHKIIQFVDIPVLVVQSKFDESQIFEQFNQIEAQHLNKISIIETFKLMDLKFTQSLKIIKSYFITSCMNHMIVTRSDWNEFKINNLSLEDILYDWIVNENRDLKLVDKCKWPDCNGACPSMRHPDTNEIISPLEYLTYMGLVDYKLLAEKLKLTKAHVNKINYFRLIKFLFN